MADTVQLGQAVVFTDGSYVDQLAFVRSQNPDGTANLVVLGGGPPLYVEKVPQEEGQAGTWRLPGTKSAYEGRQVAPTTQAAPTLESLQQQIAALMAQLQQGQNKPPQVG